MGTRGVWACPGVARRAETGQTPGSWSTLAWRSGKAQSQRRDAAATLIFVLASPKRQKARRPCGPASLWNEQPLRPPFVARPPAPALRPGRRWVGLGVRHALFPDSLTFGAQLGSSILAGCQFPDATLSRTDLRIVFGPVAGPAARRFDFRGRLVERGFSASRLVHPSTDCLLTGPDPGCDSRSRPASAGIGFDRLLGGRANLPHVTGLASLLSSCVSIRRRATLFSAPPGFRILSSWSPFSLPAGRALVGWTHSATD